MLRFPISGTRAMGFIAASIGFTVPDIGFIVTYIGSIAMNIEEETP